MITIDYENGELTATAGDDFARVEYIREGVFYTLNCTMKGVIPRAYEKWVTTFVSAYIELLRLSDLIEEIENSPENPDTYESEHEIYWMMETAHENLVVIAHDDSGIYLDTIAFSSTIRKQFEEGRFWDCADSKIPYAKCLGCGEPCRAVHADTPYCPQCDYPLNCVRCNKPVTAAPKEEVHQHGGMGVICNQCDEEEFKQWQRERGEENDISF